MICKICRQPKEPWEMASAGRGKLKSNCKVCDNRRRTSLRTPEIMARENRAKHLKSKYGIELVQYEHMLKMQGGRCKICGTDEPGHVSFSVDHCHKTGIIRGLLCNSCNVGLGRFKDNPVFMERAAAYVRRLL